MYKQRVCRLDTQEGTDEMANEQCELVQRWLQQQGPLPPPEELVDHVVACVNCRGAITATMAALLDVDSAPEVSCGACQDDLDAYIDSENAHGPKEAFRRYPHVWWHLWVCPECAETYHLTCVLVHAANVGDIDPLPFAPKYISPAAKPRLPMLRLPRAFLHAVFAPHMALGTAWSSGNGEQLIAEEKIAPYHIAVSVEQLHATGCSIGIVITPPVTGAAVVRFGETVFRSVFDSAGKATIPAVPAILLTDAAGPDMELTINLADQ